VFPRCRVVTTFVTAEIFKNYSNILWLLRDAHGVRRQATTTWLPPATGFSKTMSVYSDLCVSSTVLTPGTDLVCGLRLGWRSMEPEAE
jgi:hypothetical protein